MENQICRKRTKKSNDNKLWENYTGTGRKDLFLTSDHLCSASDVTIGWLGVTLHEVWATARVRCFAYNCSQSCNQWRKKKQSSFLLLVRDLHGADLSHLDKVYQLWCAAECLLATWFWLSCLSLRRCSFFTEIWRTANMRRNESNSCTYNWLNVSIPLEPRRHPIHFLLLLRLLRWLLQWFFILVVCKVLMKIHCRNLNYNLQEKKIMAPLLHLSNHHRTPVQ